MLDETSVKDLFLARDRFRALLEHETLEKDWQHFFTDHPYVFSRSLGLRLAPSDIVPFARPGYSEPDFIFYPKNRTGIPSYGLIELKKPNTPIVLVKRSNVAILSRDAETAVQQLRQYSKPNVLREFIPFEARQALFLGNSAYLFAIIGRSLDLDKLSMEVYREMIENCLPPNLRIIPFDELLRQFEHTVPKKVLVLVPCYTPDQKLIALLWSEDENEATNAARQLLTTGWSATSPQEESLFLLAAHDEQLLDARVNDIDSIAWKYSHPEVVRFANHISEDLAYDDEYWPRWPRWASRQAAKLLERHRKNIDWYAG